MEAKKAVLRKAKMFSDTSIYGNLHTLVGSFFDVYENFRRDIRNLYGCDMLRFLEQARDNMYFSYSSKCLKEKISYAFESIKEMNKFEMRVHTLVSPNVKIIKVSTANNIVKQIGIIKAQLNNWVLSLQAKLEKQEKV